MYSYRIPVILDTDIGTDIDDTWALVMLLKSPELDVKLITTTTGDTLYRAKIVAKMLEIAGRTDIPIGIGLNSGEFPRFQEQWVDEYDLSRYPGIVYEDGVGALTDTIMKSPIPITLIGIGPVPNIATALEKEPRIVRNARYVGMQGYIRTEGNVPSREYNVATFPAECKKVFGAPWDVTITPLDTCGYVMLDGQRYNAIRDSDDQLVRALVDNYRIWANNRGLHDICEYRSTGLMDTVAVYLSFSDDLLYMERLGIKVTDDGHTVIDDKERSINCATYWRDLEGFKDFLTHRLLYGR
ncbi:MAG: nucleoside hydrolase [Candidatus Aenigmarchaeota archaeon]|nr:nucleoside hydrolase [Candidatus Aenigmarchaeota archaeon]